MLTPSTVTAAATAAPTGTAAEAISSKAVKVTRPPPARRMRDLAEVVGVSTEDDPDVLTSTNGQELPAPPLGALASAPVPYCRTQKSSGPGAGRLRPLRTDSTQSSTAATAEEAEFEKKPRPSASGTTAGTTAGRLRSRSQRRAIAASPAATGSSSYSRASEPSGPAGPLRRSARMRKREEAKQEELERQKQQGDQEDSDLPKGQKQDAVGERQVFGDFTHFAVDTHRCLSPEAVDAMETLAPAPSRLNATMEGEGNERRLLIPGNFERRLQSRRTARHQQCLALALDSTLARKGEHLSSVRDSQSSSIPESGSGSGGAPVVPEQGPVARFRRFRTHKRRAYSSTSGTAAQSTFPSGPLTIVPGAESSRSVPCGAVVARTTGNERYACIESIQKFQRDYSSFLEGSAKRRKVLQDKLLLDARIEALTGPLGMPGGRRDSSKSTGKQEKPERSEPNRALPNAAKYDESTGVRSVSSVTQELRKPGKNDNDNNDDGDDDGDESDGATITADSLVATIQAIRQAFPLRTAGAPALFSWLDEQACPTKPPKRPYKLRSAKSGIRAQRSESAPPKEQQQQQSHELHQSQVQQRDWTPSGSIHPFALEKSKVCSDDGGKTTASQQSCSTSAPDEHSMDNSWVSWADSEAAAIAPAEANQPPVQTLAAPNLIQEYNAIPANVGVRDDIDVAPSAFSRPSPAHEANDGLVSHDQAPSFTWVKTSTEAAASMTLIRITQTSTEQMQWESNHRQLSLQHSEEKATSTIKLPLPPQGSFLLPIRNFDGLHYGQATLLPPLLSAPTPPPPFHPGVTTRLTPMFAPSASMAFVRSGLPPSLAPSPPLPQLYTDGLARTYGLASVATAPAPLPPFVSLAAARWGGTVSAVEVAVPQSGSTSSVLPSSSSSSSPTSSLVVF
ncbi:hypothetical protein DFJ73DRAFT_830488 [Zopfochytrium polystomum]|nr:hypothetical protein DFJ73DRAFT_830488 [Zopfochytrium polystomum]